MNYEKLPNYIKESPLTNPKSSGIDALKNPEVQRLDSNIFAFMDKQAMEPLSGKSSEEEFMKPPFTAPEPNPNKIPTIQGQLPDQEIPNQNA